MSEYCRDAAGASLTFHQDNYKKVVVLHRRGVTHEAGVDKKDRARRISYNINQGAIQ